MSDSTLLRTLQAASHLADTLPPAASLDALRYGLNTARAAAPSGDAWRALVEKHVRPHPAVAVALESPFVHRCFSKPRGYAGDAVMLDFIYRHPANQALARQATPRGRALMDACLTTPAPRAVRNRCRLLADEIDSVCIRNPRAEILSLACGHLREAEHSAALGAGTFKRFLAMDQDLESLAMVARDHGPLGIKAQTGSVKTVITHGAAELGSFDFIYAAGLYDYLSDRVGVRLLNTLFSMLKPGGKVWIANFALNIDDAGFMEAIMDWWLIYRDAIALRTMADNAFADLENVTSVQTFEETERNVVFLEAVKA